LVIGLHALVRDVLIGHWFAHSVGSEYFDWSFVCTLSWFGMFWLVICLHAQLVWHVLIGHWFARSVG